MSEPGWLETEPLTVVSGWFHTDWPLFSDSNYVRSCYTLVRGLKSGEKEHKKREKSQSYLHNAKKKAAEKQV